MKAIFLSIALALIVGVVGLAEAGQAQPASKPETPRYTLEVKETQRVVGVVSYDVSCPDVQASEWIIFAAVAPELPGQTQVKTTLSPGGVAIRDKSLLGRELLLAKVPTKNDKALRTAVPIQVTYEAALRSRKLVLLAPGAKADKVAELSATNRKLYLAEQGDADFKQETFKKWLAASKLTRTEGEDDITFARRSFRQLRSELTYEYKSSQDRRASAVCKAGKSDCGGMSAAFVATMRANGIPARLLYGRWATSAKPDEKIGEATYFQWHVKAEFYAENVGWVPVDTACAVLHDKSKEGLEYFGNDPGDFITFHVDTAFSVDAGPFGVKPVTHMQQPVWWVSGKGTTESAKITEGWKVKVVK